MAKKKKSQRSGEWNRGLNRIGHQFTVNMKAWGKLLKKG